MEYFDWFSEFFKQSDCIIFFIMGQRFLHFLNTQTKSFINAHTHKQSLERWTIFGRFSKKASKEYKACSNWITNRFELVEVFLKSKLPPNKQRVLQSLVLAHKLLSNSEKSFHLMYL